MRTAGMTGAAMLALAAACAPGVGERFAASPCADRPPAEGPGRLIPAPPGPVRVVTSGYGPEQRDGLVASDGTVIVPMIYDSLAPTSDPGLFRATCRADPDDEYPDDGFVTSGGVEIVPPIFVGADIRPRGPMGEAAGFEAWRIVEVGPWRRYESFELDGDGRVVAKES